jgi:hypothetical protein
LGIDNIERDLQAAKNKIEGYPIWKNNYIKIINIDGSE